jgi:hypothetical protein
VFAAFGCAGFLLGFFARVLRVFGDFFGRGLRLGWGQACQRKSQAQQACPDGFQAQGAALV